MKVDSMKREIEALKMEIAGAEDVPFIVHEAAQARAERGAKRLIIAVVLAVVLMFASNVVWLVAWLQYDYVSYDVNSEDGGNANFIGDDGDTNNGTSESQEADLGSN